MQNPSGIEESGSGKLIINQLGGRNYSLNEQETTNFPPVVLLCKGRRYII
jgi:hypothetical protein